jgi:site-specific DNA-methyltransferase (adenine-specific)
MSTLYAPGEGGVTGKCELYNDHFQNFKRYAIPRAQLVIADIPYNLGNNAYASSPSWYVDGDNANGESAKAGKSFFDTDENFNIAEYMHFCSTMLVKEKPSDDCERIGKTGKRKSNAPCMIVFCAFEQQDYLIHKAAEHGFKHYIPLVFIKNYSAQVLKANMKIVGATEYAVVFYRDKLPRFNNGGRMIYNWFAVEKDNSVPRIHPTQKSIKLLKRLIEIFTDPGDVVIDPVAGSGSTLRAAAELGRRAYGFEIKKDMYTSATTTMLRSLQSTLFCGKDGEGNV